MESKERRFQCAQQLIDSIVADPDRLLSHWLTRALVPGSRSVSAILEALIYTVSLQPLQLKVELSEVESGVKGSLHLFQNPNFAINLDALTSGELKYLAVVVSCPDNSSFEHIYNNASTNTAIYGGVRAPLCLQDSQRLLLVEAVCNHSLFLCQKLNPSNQLCLKDTLTTILLRVLRQTPTSSLVTGLSAIHQKLCAPLLPQLGRVIHSSPNSPRLRESVKEPLSPQQQLRRSRSKSEEPRNYFLGNDWFLTAYGVSEQH